jgi:hypothetical protein
MVRQQTLRVKILKPVKELKLFKSWQNYHQWRITSNSQSQQSLTKGGSWYTRKQISAFAEACI